MRDRHLKFHEERDNLVTGWLRRKRLDERLFLERYVRIRAELVGEREAGAVDQS